MKEKNIILASVSKRRHELLKLMGYDFIVVPSDANEDIPTCSPPEYVKQLAYKKAEAVSKRYPDHCVIGADTIVVLNGGIIGKPKDANDAHAILKRLSGNTHTVYTGVSVISNGNVQTECDATDVTFAHLTDKAITDYINTGDPMDKAGAYGIQGSFCVNITHMNGSYFTVIGLPVHVLHKMLQQIR